MIARVLPETPIFTGVAAAPEVPVAQERRAFPEWTPPQLHADSPLVFASEPNSIAADQYRTIAKRLALPAASGRRLLVTSPGPQDGKSTSASNLAWALSERNLSVLLLELDLRRPTFASIFPGLRARAGLERVLKGEARAEEMVCNVKGTSLSVAAVQEPQPGAAKLIQGRGLEEALQWARKRFDWLVFDAPPVLQVSDTVELSTHADPILLVVRARVTRSVLVKRSIDVLGSSLRHVLFNQSDANLRSAYGYLSYGPTE